MRSCCAIAPGLSIHDLVMIPTLKWTAKNDRELVASLRRAANVTRLPAIHTWPDWMIPEKRDAMA